MGMTHWIDSSLGHAALYNGLRALANTQAVVSPLLDSNLGFRSPDEKTRTYIFSIVHELLELADELGWKPWKAHDPPNRDRVGEEFADVLAFLGLLLNHIEEVAGLNQFQLASYYRTKTRVNLARSRGESGEPGYGEVERKRLDLLTPLGKKSPEDREQGTT